MARGHGNQIVDTRHPMELKGGKKTHQAMEPLVVE